ncbi:MAG: hypothetical protein R3A11_05320 [Bdellovibrionota bacterium]
MVPDLIIVLMVLNKVSPDRVSWANHYDRWSYLFDRVFTRSINTLYQHGIFTTQVGRFSKLQSIHRVVLKWHASEKIVRQLLKDPAKTIFEVHAEKLLFQKVGENKRSIFVVGRNFDLDGFKYLLVKLCDQPYLDKVYFKSHPLITNFSIKGLNKIEMVDVLIDVPLYISYHSSLALDLQEHGKNVIFTDGKETSQVLKDIESFFE